MTKSIKRSYVYTTLLFLILSLGIFFRVYNLNWGAPFYFHPDERNIAASVSQLIFPTQFNPHFFAYGSLPIYLTFFVGLAINFFRITAVPFSDAIFLLRVFSLLLSISLIPLVYIIGKQLGGKSVAIFAMLLTTFSTGLIQFAHFGTFEMWLTFLSTLLFLFCVQYMQTRQYKFFLFATICCGILVGIKVVSLALCILPIIALCFVCFRKKPTTQIIHQFIFSLLLFPAMIFLIYIITNPFVIFDTQSFLGSMNYESSVALGTLPVFYTGEFFHTWPIFFQMLHLYPFLVNPLITLMLPVFFIFLCFVAWEKKNIYLFFLLVTFLILFLSQAFLFVKWTRYMVPTLPFVYLIIATGWYKLLQKRKKIFFAVGAVCVIVSIVFSFSYVKTALMDDYSSVVASMWAQTTIPSEANILSEVYDMGIVPFNGSYPHITLFNFYDLDNGTIENEQLPNVLQQTDYIILPSQRILKSRILDPKDFPNGYAFYNSLVNGSLGFEKIYQTPCDIFCKIVYMGNPTFAFEETADVFDRPEVYIFKKIK